MTNPKVDIAVVEVARGRFEVVTGKPDQYGNKYAGMSYFMVSGDYGSPQNAQVTVSRLVENMVRGERELSIEGLQHKLMTR